MLIKISLETDHEGLKAAVQPVDLHEPTSVVHCPADIPAHGVEQTFFCDYLVPLNSFPSVLKTLYFYHNGNASHSAQMFVTRAADRDWYSYLVAISCVAKRDYGFHFHFQNNLV